jgi:hypothetical protein
MRNKWLLTGACVALLAGCGESEDMPAAPEEPPRETVFDPLTQTLDRAEGVQDTVEEQSEELRRRVEEAEGE